MALPQWEVLTELALCRLVMDLSRLGLGPKLSLKSHHLPATHTHCLPTANATDYYQTDQPTGPHRSRIRQQ